MQGRETRTDVAQRRGRAEAGRTGGQEDRYGGVERAIKRRLMDSGITSFIVWETEAEGTVRLIDGVAEVVTDGYWHRVPNEVWAWRPHRTIIFALPEFTSDFNGIAISLLILNNEV